MTRLLVVNPNTDVRVTAWLAEEARRIAAPDVVIEAVNADSGLAALETPEHVEIAAAAVVRAIDARAPHAALIGAFGDPGLEQSRRLGAPVAGLGDCGLRAASAIGPFAILTLGSAMRGAIGERVARLAPCAKLTDIRVLSHRISDFVRERSSLAPEIAAEIGDLARGGARCVLLAGAPFAGLARFHNTGAVVLDGVESCLNSLGLSALARAR